MSCIKKKKKKVGINCKEDQIQCRPQNFENWKILKKQRNNVIGDCDK